MKIKMNKIKLIFIQTLLFFLITISNSFGKALPPGSGVADVPANVLILLDKSGSMGISSYTGARVNRTWQITAISNTGNVIVNDGSTLALSNITVSTSDGGGLTLSSNDSASAAVPACTEDCAGVCSGTSWESD